MHIGIVNSIDILTCISPKDKDLLYIVGDTYEELGGSEYGEINGHENTNVPKVDAKKALKLYLTFSKANKRKLISSAMSVHMGGLKARLLQEQLLSLELL